MASLLRTGAPILLFFSACVATSAFPSNDAFGARTAIETFDVAAHENRVATKGYVAAERAEESDKLQLTIAVKQRNADLLLRTLYDVSDPGSAKYGHHLTNTEVQAMVAPSSTSVEAVSKWLESAGITDFAPATQTSDFIIAKTTVAQAEALFGGQAQYWVYEHAESRTNVTRLRIGDSYTVPNAVATHVDFITPTHTFPPTSRASSSATSEGLKKEPLVTPPKLRALMGLTDADVGKGSASTQYQAIASFIKQYYKKSDLEAFWKKYKQPSTGFNWEDVPKDQKHDPTGTEASLDVQWIASTGSMINTQHWSTPGVQPGNEANEPFVAWLVTLANTSDADAPQVFSISYGDEEDGVSEAYAQRCSIEFQKAGVRGITLLAASGDAGAGCAAGAFVPTFPASCPYVTGVGGTTGGQPGKFPTGESVAGLSGGGFSNYFGRPSYQDAAVAAYMKSAGLPRASMYNSSGAGFPDIAAQALQYDTCQDDFFWPIDGTSCACPAASGLWSLLGQARLDAQGKNASKLGWLNPLIYKLGAQGVFNDVTDGGNNYCDDAGGFSAAKGWDAATGWGSLNYGHLKGPVLAASAK